MLRCLCLQWIYIPHHVNRNYKANHLDRRLYVPADARSTFHATSCRRVREGFGEENHHYTTKEGKVFCGVTSKPRVQNGGADRCNECGLSLPIVLCHRVSLQGCRLEESAPILPTAGKPLMLIKVRTCAQPDRLTTKVPSNTAMCFQFKILHLRCLERDIRNAERNISKLTLRLPNWIPFVIRVTLVASKVFTHKCDTG
jgi:hypothetical protein